MKDWVVVGEMHVQRRKHAQFGSIFFAFWPFKNAASISLSKRLFFSVMLAQVGDGLQ